MYIRAQKKNTLSRKLWSDIFLCAISRLSLIYTKSIALNAYKKCWQPIERELLYIYVLTYVWRTYISKIIANQERIIIFVVYNAYYTLNNGNIYSHLSKLIAHIIDLIKYDVPYFKLIRFQWEPTTYRARAYTFGSRGLLCLWIQKQEVSSGNWVFN